MSKILITGALGHIGSGLIHSLKFGEFDDVYMIDNLSTQRYSSLFNLPTGVNFHFIEADINSVDLNNLFKGIDVVIHLAAIVDASSSFEKPDEVEKVNYLGTKRVAEACLKNGCRLFFPSTTSVYGVQGDLVDENCSIANLKPQSPYAKSKLKAELLLKDLGEKEGLDFLICRFGTIFGTSIGMRFHTAVNKFCWQASMNVPISVWRTALHQRRPYLDLTDAIEAIKFIVKNNIFNKEIYNIVTINSTVDEICQKIKTYIPSLIIEFVDTEIMNQLSYNVSGEKFRKLGFETSGDIEHGISDTIKLLKNANIIP